MPPEQACDEEADERQEDDCVIHVVYFWAVDRGARLMDRMILVRTIDFCDLEHDACKAAQCLGIMA